MSNFTENQAQPELKLGNFLIEKLLNTDKDLTNEIQINLSKNDDNKEDVVSETGTYTIEEKADQKENQIENQLPFKSIDLMSARAAIDETFGIIDKPDIINDATEKSQETEESVLNSPTPGSKRQPQKLMRERNLTYSLTHDLVVQLKNQDGAEGEEQTQNDENIYGTTASLTKTKTYDIIAHNQDLLVDTTTRDSNDYQSPVATDAVPTTQSLDLSSQVSSTKSAVDTELLLGNTEQLMESIKKRRSDKKLALQQRLANANNLIKESTSTKPLSPSSSSSCSSSTMSIEKTDMRSWTIPTGDDNNHPKSAELSQVTTTTRRNPTKKLNSSNSDVDSSYSDQDTSGGVHLQKRGNGGMAFEFIMSNDNKNSPVTKPSKPIQLTSANLARHRSAAARSSDTNSSGFNPKQHKPTNQSSYSTQSSKTTTSKTPRSNHASITRNYNRTVSKSDDATETCTNVSGFATPKSGTSLGAKIQAKASSGRPTNSVETRRASVSRRASDNSFQSVNSQTTSNASNNSSCIASPYTNRTLYLRQQSALAKRESLNSSEKKPLNGILKNKTQSRQVSRTNSRNTSPYSTQNVPAHQSSLMTGSLNLPSGSALPDQASTGFQRRKNYDPIKAVEMDKQNKLTRKSLPAHQQLQSSTSRNSIGSNVDYDSMSEASSFSMSMQPNTNPHANSQKQSYEKILQSTLQRLCIRLIQMSTGVLDKIGDENGNSNTDTNLFSAMESCNELERMQQLAKLVHSMQLVHDHIQIIDTSLSNKSKPEDPYMKELTKIRQEVETLKMSAANNSSANSSINFN